MKRECKKTKKKRKRNWEPKNNKSEREREIFEEIARANLFFQKKLTDTPHTQRRTINEREKANKHEFIYIRQPITISLGIFIYLFKREKERKLKSKYVNICNLFGEMKKNKKTMIIFFSFKIYNLRKAKEETDRRDGTVSLKSVWSAIMRETK